MQLEVKKEFTYDPYGSFSLKSPYAIAFVYPKNSNPFIVQGGKKDIENYLSSEFKEPAIVHYHTYEKGIEKTIYKVINVHGLRIRITSPSWPYQNRRSYLYPMGRRGNIYPVRNVKRAKMSIEVNGSLTFKKEFRRVPRKWIKEINPFILDA